jgi:hypothetical protein
MNSNNSITDDNTTNDQLDWYTETTPERVSRLLKCVPIMNGLKSKFINKIEIEFVSRFKEVSLISVDFYHDANDKVFGFWEKIELRIIFKVPMYGEKGDRIMISQQYTFDMIEQYKESTWDFMFSESLDQVSSHLISLPNYDGLQLRDIEVE